MDQDHAHAGVLKTLKPHHDLASPNGLRLSGERSGAERVRCSRGLGATYFSCRNSTCNDRAARRSVYNIANQTPTLTTQKTASNSTLISVFSARRAKNGTNTATNPGRI